MFFPILNLVYYLNKKRGIKWFGFGLIPIYLFILIYGSFNMWNPVVVSYDVELYKETELDELKILLVSDIHISETIRNNFINRLINLSDDVEPDMIFLAGDIIDSSIDPYLKHNIGETLVGLTAPMGVYAVLGNHEYYGNDIPIFIEEMNEIGIQVLVDEVINFNDLFYIVGRKDYSDKDRESIDELTSNLSKEKTIFLIDHQPQEFDEVNVAGVDLMVSGHTHKGQLFPGNLITKAIYENHYGYLIKDDLHTIVSSGFGIWGPPFRIGSRSEVVEINVKFVNEEN
ncbi:metallophosphoesterase [Bacillaceae bacterium IKA-2]|nr:metallophosphoesterase [Bacillaceae bacterium IKA-2]